MEQTLLKDTKYNGRYVALRDFNDPTVLADGGDPQEVYAQAVKNGCAEPVILFVPSKDMVQIY